MQDDTRIKKPEAEALERFYRTLTRLMLAQPDKLEVRVDELDGVVELEAAPAQGDVPRLVGRHKSTFEATRLLLRMATRRLGFRQFYYSVADPRRFDARKPSRPLEFAPRDDWPAKAINDAVDEVLGYVLTSQPRVEYKHDGDKTGVTLLLHPDEPQDVVAPALREALNRIVSAWGRNNGRVIFVDDVRRSP
jgi:predicted RNA-binding protein YlqC (UPF0109 family)